MSESMAAQIVPYLPFALRGAVSVLTETEWSELEELRFKPEQPIVCRFHERETLLASENNAGARIVSADEMRKILLLLADSSLYAFEEELRRGYLTLPGGHRVGLTGRAVLEHGAVKTLKDISGLNIRLARHVAGVARPLLPQLLDEDGRVLPSLIVAPPRAGKTTMLRDLARLLADGVGVAPRRVGMVDERSELAAMRYGQPQLPIGLRCDVLDGCPKAEGMQMLLRSMSPEVLVVDELGRPEDAQAVQDAAHAGVSVLASAHGCDGEEISRRPVLAELLVDHAFARVVVLSRRLGPCTIERVYEP